MLFNPYTSESEVLQTILILKPNVLKLAAPYITSVLAHIINNIMVQGLAIIRSKQQEYVQCIKMNLKKIYEQLQANSFNLKFS